MKTSILGLNRHLRFYLFKEPINMSKGIEGLRGIVYNELKMNPENGSVYIFVSKNRRQMKLLHYYRGVYTLYTRKIYKGTFVFPKKTEDGKAFQMEWLRLQHFINGRIIRKTRNLY